MANREQGRTPDRARSRPLVQTSYQDGDGKHWAVWLPEGEEDVTKGIPIGPQDISGLGLPKDIELALHNQLFHRGLFNWRDIRHNQRELVAAIQAAYKVDAAKINNLYQELA